MKKIITIILIALITMNIALGAEHSEILGREWYERRAEGSPGPTAQAGPISMAIKYYEIALQNSPSEENTIWLLKCYYFKGSFVNMSREDKKTLFDKGKTIGEKMAAKYPHSAAIKYWLAAQYGKWAKAYGPIKAAREGLADKVHKLAEDVVSIDPTYNEGGGYALLGLLHYHAPYIPFFLTWPDDEIALENLKKAMLAAPSPANKLCYARAIEDSGRHIESINLLKETIQMNARAEKLIEDRNSIAQAKELLTELLKH